MYLGTRVFYYSLFSEGKKWCTELTFKPCKTGSCQKCLNEPLPFHAIYLKTVRFILYRCLFFWFCYEYNYSILIFSYLICCTSWIQKAHIQEDESWLGLRDKFIGKWLWWWDFLNVCYVHKYKYIYMKSEQLI